MNENVNVCITPKGEKPVLHFSQFDNERVFTVTVLADDGESAAVLTGLDIEFRLRKTDSHVVTIAPESVADNVITFKTTEQMCACCGQNIATVTLMKDDMIISTLDILVDIQRDILSGGLTSESDIRNLTTQIETIIPEVLADDYYTKTEVDELIDDIPTFDPTNYYDKSDVDGLLSDKADKSDVYTKAQTDSLLFYKVDKINDTAASDLPADIVTLTNAGNDCPMSELTVAVTAVQAGSGIPTPSTPRPISGFSGANIVSCKNLWNSDLCVEAYIDGNGQAVANASNITQNFGYYCKANQSITISANTTVYNIGYCVIRASDGVVTSRVNNNNVSTVTVTPTENSYIKVWISKDNQSLGTLEQAKAWAKSAEIQIEFGTSRTTYGGEVAINISFGQEVYGGVLDVTNGKLKITSIGHIFDGSENFVSLASNTVFAYHMGTGVVGSYGQNNAMCSHYINNTGGGSWDSLNDYTFLVAGSYYFGVKPMMSLADYKTYLTNQNTNGTPVTAVATLATPTEITLTPAEVDTISGINNIYADTGNILTLRYFGSNAEDLFRYIRLIKG